MDVENQIKEGFILPGEVISAQQKRSYDSSSIVPTSQGLTSLFAGFPSVNNVKDNQVLTIQKFSSFYLPQKNDLVIGIVKVRTSETFILDIGGPLDATLGALDFDGVTKRNKPNILVGGVVYCRVSQYSKYTGAKVSCINKGFSNKKNNQLGELKGGTVTWIPAYRHHLAQQKLESIGKYVKFEIAFGKNGWVWIQSNNEENLMIIINALKLVSENSEEEVFQTMLSMLKI